MKEDLPLWIKIPAMILAALFFVAIVSALLLFISSLLQLAF